MESTFEEEETEVSETKVAKERVKVNRFGRFMVGVLLACLLGALLDTTGIARDEVTRPLHHLLPELIGIFVFGMLFLGRL